MEKLRTVEFWVNDKNIKRRGFFHTWGHRQDENLADFFGVVEDELGACLELDPIQIKFIDNQSLSSTRAERPGKSD